MYITYISIFIIFHTQIILRFYRMRMNDICFFHTVDANIEQITCAFAD